MQSYIRPVVAGDKPAGPDGIRWRRPHLIFELEVRVPYQAVSAPVRPVCHHAWIACAPWETFTNPRFL